MARAALGGMRSRRSRQGGSIKLLLRLSPLTSSFLSHYSGFADANRATSVPLSFGLTLMRLLHLFNARNALELIPSLVSNWQRKRAADSL